MKVYFNTICLVALLLWYSLAKGQSVEGEGLHFKIATGEVYHDWRYLTEIGLTTQLYPIAQSDWPVLSLHSLPTLGVFYDHSLNLRWAFSVGVEWTAFQIKNGRVSHSLLGLETSIGGTINSLSIPIELEGSFISSPEKGRLYFRLGVDAGYNLVPQARIFTSTREYFSLISRFYPSSWPAFNYRIGFGWQSAGKIPVQVGLIFRGNLNKSVELGAGLYSSEEPSPFGIPSAEDQIYSYQNHLLIRQLQIEVRVPLTLSSQR